MMKRFRFYGDEMNENMERYDLANVLMLLSTGQKAVEKVFECKTCNRQFSSFQALGGHRASHKKPRMGRIDGPDAGPAKPRVHECSVCGLEFAIGQALGGHMRRHRVSAEVNGPKNGGWAGEKEPMGRKVGVGLDLNLLPPVEAEEVRRPPKILGFALTPEIVNCL